MVLLSRGEIKIILEYLFSYYPNVELFMIVIHHNDKIRLWILFYKLLIFQTFKVYLILIFRGINWA